MPGNHIVEIRHFHLFCGLGGGARGFNRGQARVGSLVAKFRCLGGIDNDAAAIRDFGRLAKTPGTVLDLFSQQQYIDFHGKLPPGDWREATADDIRRAAGGERPHIVFLSPPCKGLSGLLAESLSKTRKYVALNGLTVRGVRLMLEAWGDDPPELVVLENVPRIATRGRPLLDQICQMLRAAGYEVAESKHNCGEIGGLGQSRERFLLVARHAAKVPPLMYEPAKRRLRGVGEVIGQLPIPGDLRAGPMHRVPMLAWKTWVRLAFVKAGADWRCLNELAVEDGVLRDFAIVPDGHWRDDIMGVLGWQQTCPTVTGNAGPTTGRYSVADPRTFNSREGTGYLGVHAWDRPMGTVTGRSKPGTGAFCVGDPRDVGGAHNGSLGVIGWDQASGTVAGATSPTNGRYAVADPRRDEDRAAFGQYGVKGWGETSQTVISKAAPGAGNFSVADIRVEDASPRFENVYRIVERNAGLDDRVVDDPRGPNGCHTTYKVTHFEDAAGTVIAASTTGQGAFAVADPRPGYGPGTHQNILHVNEWDRRSKTVHGGTHPAGGALSVADPRPVGLNARRDHYQTAGHYGVVPWTAPTGAVSAHPKNNNGAWSVADPRDAVGDHMQALPTADDRLVAVIRALDGTWHRPFTTLELAALQSLVDLDELDPCLSLDGVSDSAHRERIGNAVPPDAAQAIAGVMGRVLLQAWSGQSFQLSNEPIWVRPVAVALSVDFNQQIAF